MYKLGNIMQVLGTLLILASAIGNITDLSPKNFDWFYLASTSTVFTASGIIIKRGKPLDRK
ncbi:hypothetical protein ACFDTO_14850 [Microbacteriaceae bacterium 4G12]